MPFGTLPLSFTESQGRIQRAAETEKFTNAGPQTERLSTIHRTHRTKGRSPEVIVIETHY